jgi:hypothetical protein
MAENLATADIPENAQDLTLFVQNLLEQMVCNPNHNTNPNPNPDTNLQAYSTKCESERAERTLYAFI